MSSEEGWRWQQEGRIEASVGESCRCSGHVANGGGAAMSGLQRAYFLGGGTFWAKLPIMFPAGL